MYVTVDVLSTWKFITSAENQFQEFAAWHIVRTAG